MENKVKLITPFLMLLAGAIASIIMYIRHFDLFTMLWALLLVLVIFYVIGDIVRYIYESIRPRIIPDMDEDFESEPDFDSVITKGNETEDTDSSEQQEQPTAQETDEEEGQSEMADASEEEGYTDENLD